MSHQLAGFAGFLAVVAIATPHLGSVVSPASYANASLRAAHAIDTPAPPPIIVAAPRPFAPARVEQAPAYTITISSDLVATGDAKTADFDPEHPPADMGEPG